MVDSGGGQRDGGGHDGRGGERVSEGQRGREERPEDGDAVPETGQDATELAELLALDPPPPDRTLRYGDHPAQLVDCYGAAPPRVALLHGGFWRERFDRTHLAPFAAELATHGMSAALVEYRRTGGGGGYPETFDDVIAGLDVVRAAAGGAPPLLLGHSAGGQLALWAASRAPDRMGPTVAVAPLADLRRAVALDLGRGAVAGFLGGGWEDRLALTDPLGLPSPPRPVTLVHGTADQQVPLDLSLNYAERHPARLLRLPGVGHYGPLVPSGLPFTTLALALRHLLAEPAG